MFAIISTLIVFLPVAILPLALKTGFTSLELNDMGVYLESSEDVQSMPVDQKMPDTPSHAGHSCLFTGLSV